MHEHDEDLFDDIATRLRGRVPGEEVWIVQHIGEVGADNPPVLLGPFCCGYHAQKFIYLAESELADDDTPRQCYITQPFGPGEKYYDMLRRDLA